MFDDRVEILKYSAENLASFLSKANQSKSSKEYISGKYHTKFLQDFLAQGKGLDATFIVIEKQYISKDYLADFASYYSTCYSDYQKKCARLHFFTFTSENIEEFKNLFKKTVLEGVSRNRAHKAFWDEFYLGFIVVKPIPNNFIGYTLFKHYNYKKTHRSYKDSSFWGVKKYKVHVFGNEVELESLAFQEQDRNVAACATIAIWSMLQIAAEDYHVVLKSPSEITLGSGITNHDGNRLMPNEGLTAPLMAQAISANNLVTEIRHITDKESARFNHYLKKLVYAYSHLRIPIILGISVPDANENMIGHAVAICGHEIEGLYDHRQNNKKNILQKILPHKTYYDSHIAWNAERIVKLYAHDDQWGPFASFELIGTNYIDSSWSSEHTGIRKLTQPAAVIVSVFPMHRVSYDRIEETVLGLDKVMGSVKKVLRSIGEPIWDIRLYYSEDFKTKIQESDSLDDKSTYDQELQLWLLTNDFPKFIWIATFMIDEYEIFHFIYDATGLVGTNLLHRVFGYYKPLTEGLTEYLKSKKADPNYDELLDYSLDDYIEQLSNLIKLET